MADVFFWFWCEFMVAGIATFLFLVLCPTAQKGLPKNAVSLAIFSFGFSFLYLSFFATLFAALAYKGEWQTWDRFPQFLADKEVGVAVLVLSFALLLAFTLVGREGGNRGAETLGRLFNRKCVIVAGFYVLFLVHSWIREWTTGARSLNLSPTYLKAMGVTLLGLKLLAEAGLFDGPFKRRRSEAGTVVKNPSASRTALPGR